MRLCRLDGVCQELEAEVLHLKAENAKLKAQTKFHARAQELLAKWDSLKSSRAAVATPSLPSNGPEFPVKSISEQHKEGASTADNHPAIDPQTATSCGSVPTTFQAPPSVKPVSLESDQLVAQLPPVDQEERQRTAVNVATNDGIAQKASVSAVADIPSPHPDAACSHFVVDEAITRPRFSATGVAQFCADEQSLQLPTPVDDQQLARVSPVGEPKEGIVLRISKDTGVDGSPSPLEIPSTSQSAIDVWLSRDQKHAQACTGAGTLRDQLASESDHGLDSNRSAAFRLATVNPTFVGTHASGSPTRKPKALGLAAFQRPSANTMHVTPPLASANPIEVPLPQVPSAPLAIDQPMQVQGPQVNKDPDHGIKGLDTEPAAKVSLLPCGVPGLSFGHLNPMADRRSKPSDSSIGTLSLTMGSESLSRSKGLMETHVSIPLSDTQTSQATADSKIPTSKAGTDKPATASGGRLASIMDATVWMQWAAGGCASSQSSGAAKCGGTSGVRQQCPASLPKVSTRNSRKFLPSLRRS